MNLATRALIGASAAGLGLLLAATNGISAAIVTAASVLAAAGVAASSQQMRFRKREQLVYRPIYVRAATVHRPVRYEGL